MCLSIKVHHPELVLNEGKHAGHEWVVVSNGIGYRCGYVKVEPGHPWYGKHYDSVDALVHGGLTFAEADTPCTKGGPDDGWWFGFDCAHYGDAPDLSLPLDEPRRKTAESLRTMKIPGQMVRTQEYVEDQCRQLCQQAKAAAQKAQPKERT